MTNKQSNPKEFNIPTLPPIFVALYAVLMIATPFVVVFYLLYVDV